MSRLSAPCVAVIEPSKGVRWATIRESWDYRGLLWMLMARDLTLRYRQTFLGVAWVALRPLLGTAVLTVVFGRMVRVPSDGAPYAPFVLCALLPWTFFSSGVSACGTSVLGAAGLISKVRFPRLVIPLAAVGGMFVDFIVTVAMLFALLPFYGIWPSASLLFLPAMILPLVLLTFGAGAFLSALSVRYRDVGGLAAFGLQIGMYLTPVVYPMSLVPDRWRFALHLNPMAAIVEGFRSAFLGRPIDCAGFLISLGFSAAVCAVGLVYFLRVEKDFADVI